MGRIYSLDSRPSNSGPVALLQKAIFIFSVLDWNYFAMEAQAAKYH